MSLHSLALAIALAATTLTDLALGLAVLYRPRPARLRLGRAVRGILTVSVFFFFKMVAVFFLGIHHGTFLVMHMAYLDLVIALPLIALTVLASARRVRATVPVVLLALASLGAIPIGIYASFVEPFQLVVERAEVEIDPRRLSRPLTIGVLADIQCTRVSDHERRAVELVMRERPDLIVLPGDLAQIHEHERERKAEQFRELLRALDAPLGVYFSIGNCEQPSWFREFVRGSGVRVLSNEVVELERDGERITVAGTALNVRSRRTRELVAELESRPEPDDLRLLLSHLPDVMLELEPDTRVDLIVSGHTHGGQVSVPFFGPPFTLSRVPRSVGAGGLHRVGGRTIYVSRGVGCERGKAPRIRFGAPPEVTILTLVPGPRGPQ